MIEIIAIICLVLVVFALMGFILYRDSQARSYQDKLEKILVDFPVELQRVSVQVVNDRNKDMDTLLGKTFTAYLKHIQVLEKSVLPKRVTTRMVQDVLDRATPEVTENEIESEGEKKVVIGPDGKLVDPNEIEINEDNFGSIPINKKTKVAFEEDLPQDIIEE